MRCLTRGIIGFTVAAGLAVGASAATITHTLGNASPGFADGDTPAVLAVGGAQSGQPVPFDMAIGNDVLGPVFSASWVHSYGPIADAILSASVTIGIVDHDSAATGSQLDSFVFAGADLKSALDSQFEAAGEGGEAQYDVYTLSLPASSFVDLADGSTAGSLALLGPGLVVPLFPLPGPNPPVDSASNGAYLIFSTLLITTRDPGTGTVIPEPSTAWLVLLGLFLLGLYGRGRRWRRRRD